MKSLINYPYQIPILLGSFSILFFFLPVSLQSQQRGHVESARMEIIREIDKTNNLLNETALNRKAHASDITILEKQIDEREKLINKYEEEIATLENQILNREERINYSQNVLDSLTEQYLSVLRAMYRHKISNKNVFSLLSTRIVENFVIKDNYYRILKKSTLQKLEQIKSGQTVLLQELNDLEEDQNQLRSNLTSIDDQKIALENAKAMHRVFLSSLKEDEKALKIALANQKKNREMLNVAIEKIINSKFGETGEVNINASIEINRNNGLIWPVSDGLITSKFGKQRHPTIKTLFINNNGVDIRVPKASDVISVESGNVISVTVHQGFGKMVILDHGDFHAVYSKLENVQVKEGQQINPGDIIGQLSSKNNISELHFEIWKNKKAINPEKWLQ